VDETLSQLTDALRERLTIVGDDESRRDPERHMKRLKDVSFRLEELEQRLPSTVDPQLRHYCSVVATAKRSSI
jgi:hypothetical protein